MYLTVYGNIVLKMCLALFDLFLFRKCTRRVNNFRTNYVLSFWGDLWSPYVPFRVYAEASAVGGALGPRRGTLKFFRTIFEIYKI